MPFIVPALGAIGGFLGASGAAATALGAATVGGVASIGANLYNASKERGAIADASAAQQAQNNLAIAESRRQYDQTRTDQLPFVQAGQQALGQQQGVLGAQRALLGLDGASPQSAAIAQLKASPMWQSLFGAGEDAILANASATGGLRGGNTQRSLYRLGNDTLAQLIERQVANLGGLSGQYGAIAGQGTNTAANLGQLGAQTATNIGNIQIGSGQAQAGGILGRANTNAEALNSVLGTVGKIAGKAGWL